MSRASASRGAAPAGRVDLRHAHVPDAAQAVLAKIRPASHRGPGSPCLL
jgi:hypothetical protein